jgi:hypothetical protein
MQCSVKERREEKSLNIQTGRLIKKSIMNGSSGSKDPFANIDKYEMPNSRNLTCLNNV